MYSDLLLVESKIPPRIAEKLKEIGRNVAPPPTEALYAPQQRREPYPGIKVLRDQSYGSHSRNLLDVFAPEGVNAGNRPVLMFVHGGAFARGDRRAGPNSPFYDNIMIWAAENGMVGVNMTYRLAPEFQWPAAQEDIASAIHWVKANIAVDGGDPDRIYLMGHSAGAAHVAQYIGHRQFQPNADPGLAGAIMISGLFDPATANDPTMALYFGVDRSVYSERSALPGLATSTLPMLFAHAELDPDTFHQQGDEARRELGKNGSGRHEFILLQGHSHMSEVFSINSEDTALTGYIRRFIFDR